MDHMDKFRLARRSPHKLIPQQTALFQNRQGLRVSTGLERFSAEQARDILKEGEGRRAIALGIGGTNLVRANVVVHRGAIEIVDVETLVQGGEGRGYLSRIQEIAKEIADTKVSVGIAVAGPVENKKILAAPNLPIFFEEVVAACDGELTRLFPDAAVAMDDVFSTLAATMIAMERQPRLTAVVNCTVGSGIGGAIYLHRLGGKIFALEPGHIEVIEQLIPVRGYRKPCGLDGARFTCIENIASGIAIADLYEARNHARLSGEQLSHLASQGDEVVTDLYANSALLVAHSVIVPARDVFGEFGQPGTVCVAFEGGVHKVPGYLDLLIRTLALNLGFTPSIIYPEQVPTNASLIGAAIAALTSPAQ